MAKHKPHHHQKHRQKLPKEEGLSVNVIDGNIDKAIRRLKRKVETAGVLKELRERQHYTKPSEKRKLAKAAARKRWLKKQRQLDNY
jgi:small subunit ribosomal protein S21